MKTFFYYCYYCLYQWSVRRDKNIPMLFTVAWITFTLFCNVLTLLALITIFTGMNAIPGVLIRGSRYENLIWLSIWGFFNWLGLKFFHVHEKAFSDEMKKKYQTVGCKGWWVVTYHLVSCILMGVTVWFAGARLGMH